MTAQYGLEAAHASRSRRPVMAKASMILVTSGPHGFGSLASAGLQSSLVSKLQRRATGSILYHLTWKVQPLPSGRLIYRLRASAARTNANAFTGWPTPTTPSGGQTVPPGTSPTGRRPDGSKATVTLANVAALCGWNTTRATDGSNGGPNQGGGALSADAHLAGWPSAKANNNTGVGTRGEGGENLQTAVQLASWATTTTRDWRSDRSVQTSEELYGSKGQPLARQVLYSDATGYSVTTPSCGLLSGEHSRWLMRIPPEWSSCAAMATRLTPKSRRRS